MDTTTTQPDITEDEERELAEELARQAEETRKNLDKLSQETKDLLNSSGKAAQRRRREGDDSNDDGDAPV